MPFKDKVVIVTGASSGIGAATALLFAKHGAKLTLVARNQQKLEALVETIITEHKTTPQVILADVSKEEDVATIIPETINKWGKLDVLVNNAGTGGADSISHPKFVQFFEHVYKTNLLSVVTLTNQAAAYLVETKGNIVNVSSVSGLTPVPFATSYSVSKAALNHLTKCNAQELAPRGVRVNSVNPGPVDTSFVVNVGLPIPDLDAFNKKNAATLPLQRISDADEIAEAIVFLASDKARSITGINMPIDCGAQLVGYKYTF